MKLAWIPRQRKGFSLTQNGAMPRVSNPDVSIRRRQSFITLRCYCHLLEGGKVNARAPATEGCSRARRQSALASRESAPAGQRSAPASRENALASRGDAPEGRGDAPSRESRECSRESRECSSASEKCSLQWKVASSPAASLIGRRSPPCAGAGVNSPDVTVHYNPNA